MIGTVDDYGRALCFITVRHPATCVTVTLQAWIDTGFTGGVMLTRSQISGLGLSATAAARGTLADGTQTLFETYSCLVDWFGHVRNIEALGGSGRFALIGVGLLEDLRLTIDYPAKAVFVFQPPRPG